jgi:hypothetical protein
VRLARAKADFAQAYADLRQAAGILASNDLTPEELDQVRIALSVWMQKDASLGSHAPAELRQLAELVIGAHNEFTI